MRGRSVVWGHLAIFVTNILFGLNTNISKVLMTEVFNPPALTFFRMIGAAILFWTASIFVKREKITKKEALILFFASLLGVVINQFSFIKGLSLTSPIQAAIVITFTPIFTMLISAIYLKEPLTTKKIMGVFIGASGAILLILTGTLQNIGGGSVWGNIFCLISCLSYGLYLVLFKNFISRFHPVTLMKWMFLFASVLCFPMIFGDLQEVQFHAVSMKSYMELAYVVIVATFVTYLLIPIGQKTLRPTTFTMYNYFQPIVAAIVAVWLGIDSFGWNRAFACLLVCAGVYLVTQSRAKGGPPNN